MKKEKVSQVCQMSSSCKTYLKEEGLLNKNDDFDDQDIHNISLIISLKNMGFKTNEIKQYISGQCDSKDMLLNKRKDILEKIHQLYKVIDEIDYFLYHMDK